MKGRAFILAATLTTLMGCQSAARSYDGVLGFKAISSSTNTVEIFYVDEAKREWPEIEKRAKKACAAFLETRPEKISLSVLSRVQFSQVVAMSVPITTGPSSTGRSTGPNGTGATGVVMPHSTALESVGREMQLKKLNGTCENTANP